MIHVYQEGSNNRVIVALHGTGGEATQLFEIAHYIDPQAHRIGIQGDVVEEGMNRYFERYPDGTFNSKSLAKATQHTYETIQQLLRKYRLDQDEVIVIGYSNGANVLQSIMKDYKTKYTKTVLFHPSILREDVPFKKQHGSVLITSGKQDPYTNPEAFSSIHQAILASETTVKTFVHPFGHQVIQEEINAAKAFINDSNESL